MKKIFWMAALCLSFMIMPLVARAEQGKAPVAAPAAGMDEKMAAEEQKTEAELGLNPEQRQKMQALRQESQAKQKALMDELRSKRASLKDELESDNPNRGKVDGLVADVKALQGKMLDNRIDQVFKMRATLTPEQYQKLKELRKKHQADGGGMKGKMHERAHDKKDQWDK